MDWSLYSRAVGDYRFPPQDSNRRVLTELRETCESNQKYERANQGKKFLTLVMDGFEILFAKTRKNSDNLNLQATIKGTELPSFTKPVRVPDFMLGCLLRPVKRRGEDQAFLAKVLVKWG